MRANDFLTEQPGTIAVVNTPVADKNISMGDQRMQKFKQQMQKDGGYQYTSKATKDAIKKSDKRVQTAMQKQAQVDQRQGAGASTIQRVKPVTFPKATSTAMTAMDDINEAFEQAINEFGPAERVATVGGTTVRANSRTGKVSANTKIGNTNLSVDNTLNKDGSSGQASASTKIGNTTATYNTNKSGQQSLNVTSNLGNNKKVSATSNIAKPGAKPVTKITRDDINEAFEQAIFEDEVTLEDTQDFHEEYGYLGYSIDENDIFEAEYRGRKVKLNKPMQGDVKKFKVYVKNKKGNVIKVNFGHGGSSVKGKTMRIRKSNPKARKSFRARHNCDNPGPKTKARYWSCRKW
jgi:hypothetical protein